MPIILALNGFEVNNLSMLKLPNKMSKIPLIGGVVEYGKDPIAYHQKFEKLNLPLVYDKLFGQYFFIMYDPEIIEHVFVTGAKKYYKNKFLKSYHEFFGDGLLVSDGDKWRSDRKLIQTSFSRPNVINYSQRINNIAKKIITTYSTTTDFNTNQEMNKLTLSIFLSSVLGIELTEEIYADFVATTEMCIKYFEFTSTPVGLMLGKAPTPMRSNYLKGIKKFEQIIFEMIENKKNEINNGHIKNDLITSLLMAKDENGQELSKTNLRDQILTFFLAGHETTALTLNFALYLLAKHQDYQERLSRELHNHFPDGELKFEKIDELTLLDQIIFEILRMYPTSWMLGRDAIVDDQIKEYKIPKKSMMVLPIWAIHRSHKYYDNPDEFHPERWTAEFKKQLPKTAYMPFGIGPRICIGQTFAMYELKIILGIFFMNFKAELKSPQKLDINIAVMARPKQEILLQLRKRN